MIFRLIPPAWLLIGAVLAVGVAGFQGYRMGVKLTEAKIAAETKRLQGELNEAGDEIARQAAELVRVQSEKRGLIDALELAARSDPDAVNRVPSTDSLQRLRSRWGSDSQ